MQLCAVPVESDAAFIGAVHGFLRASELHHFVAIALPQDRIGRLIQGVWPQQGLPALEFIQHRLDSNWTQMKEWKMQIKDERENNSKCNK